MTSAFVLNEFNFDLSPSRLLVLWLLIVIIILCTALYRVAVLDEAIVGDGREAGGGVDGLEPLALVC